jgi:hypothetical protein
LGLVRSPQRQYGRRGGEQALDEAALALGRQAEEAGCLD